MRRDSQGQRPTVVFSVELELSLGAADPQRQEALAQHTGDLLALLDEQQLPVTWGVADPAQSAATAAVLASRAGHEIAVLGEPSWLAADAGRVRQERELHRRLDGARRAGMSVSTLILRDIKQPLALDLLLAAQVKAVSWPVGQPLDGGLSGRLRRFGVWNAPAAWRVPMVGCWWRPFGWHAAVRLRNVIGSRRTLHVAIDGDGLIASGDAGLAQIRTLVTRVSRLRKQDRVAVRTLGELAAEQLANRCAEPTRSILQPAA
jgi:hypothetical protein